MIGSACSSGWLAILVKAGAQCGPRRETGFIVLPARSPLRLDRRADRRAHRDGRGRGRERGDLRRAGRHQVRADADRPRPARPVPGRRRRRLWLIASLRGSRDRLARDPRRGRRRWPTPRAPRRAPRTRAGRVRDRVLGVGHADRRADLVGGDLPPARARPDAGSPTFERYVETIHPDDREAFQAAVDDGARRRTAVRPRVPAPLAGRLGPLDPRRRPGLPRRRRASPSGWSAPAQDITEARRLEAERDQLCSTSAARAPSARRSSTSSRTSCGPRSPRSSG